MSWLGACRFMAKSLHVATATTSTDPSAMRAAYLARWRARLEPQLTAAWRSSDDIAAALGETNAKVLERMRDLVDAGIAQRQVATMSRTRKSTALGPFRSFFRLAVGPTPPPPQLVPGAPPTPRRRQPRPFRGGPQLQPPPPSTLHTLHPDVVTALVDEIGAFLSGVTAVDRRALIQTYERTGAIDSRYDRALLASCGRRLGRTLSFPEKKMMRRA
jgi:DNA-binding Lrp family transcriptional regulator